MTLIARLDLTLPRTEHKRCSIVSLFGVTDFTASVLHKEAFSKLSPLLSNLRNRQRSLRLHLSLYSKKRSFPFSDKVRRAVSELIAHGFEIVK